MIERVNSDKVKYSHRKSMVEHFLGTIKISMNFTYLLLRNLENMEGEISFAFFSYNLKRVINNMGLERY